MNWEIHLEKVRTWIASVFTEKYTEGVRRHGGTLWKKPVLWSMKELLAELLDALAYFHVAQQKIELVYKLLLEIEHTSDVDLMRRNVRRALDTLTRDDKD